MFVPYIIDISRHVFSNKLGIYEYIRTFSLFLSLVIYRVVHTAVIYTIMISVAEVEIALFS